MSTYEIKAVPSRDLYEILRTAGLVPANCGDVIIEMRVDQPVKIHTQSFPDERICDAMEAFVKAAKVQEPDHEHEG